MSRRDVDAEQVQHYSVLALAPIPVLACLGRELGNKVTTEQFQRHSDQTWRWREEGTNVEYSFHKVRDGSDPGCVALQLSLSGRIAAASLPADVDGQFTVYELTLRDQEPGRDFLCKRDDLKAFRRAYRDALARIVEGHPGARELHAFPAVPAPVAIACGQEIMPKAHPALVVYDNSKGTFVRAITINTEEDNET